MTQSQDPRPAQDGQLDRRTFLRAGAGAGGALLVIYGIPTLAKHFDLSGGPRAADDAASVPQFSPNAFVRIDQSGAVTLTVPQVEMGQGTYTSMAMLIAEELEVGLDQVRVEHAPPDDKLFVNPAFGFQATGGSTSIRTSFDAMRQAGAAARSLLVSAAASAWGVDATSCYAENGVVVHAPTERRAPYGTLVEAAAALPLPAKITLKDPKHFKLIGTPAKRLDTPDKINGKAVFGIDVKLPGMQVATVAACPVFGGTLAHFDEIGAMAVKGVSQIVRLDDAVAVVAKHMGAALKGLSALDIAWNEARTPDFPRPTSRPQQQPRRVRRAWWRMRSATSRRRPGKLPALEAIYTMPLLAHAAMEPANCTVHVRKDGCDLWLGTQVISRARATAAEVTGLPIESVTVHNHLLGGGFGRRLEIDYVTQAVKIASHVNGPVKVVWTREEDIQHDIFRPYYLGRLRAGLDAEGMPVSFAHRVVGASIMARWQPRAFQNGIDADAVDGAAGPYSIPNSLVDYVRQELPPGLKAGFWRGVGMTRNAFMVEGFVDELAEVCRQGSRGISPRIAHGFASRARSSRSSGRQSELGAPMPARSGRGVSLLFGFGSYVAQVAEVTVADDGKVRVNRVVCAVDCGQVVNPDTVKAQIEGDTIFGLSAALYGEITIENGRVEQANFDTYPVLRMDEAPAIEVHLVASSEAPGGIGEPGTSGVAPAVVNAIFAAVGVRLRHLPIRPAAVLQALTSQRRGH